jgi:hypothetical protein
VFHSPSEFWVLGAFPWIVLVSENFQVRFNEHNMFVNDTLNLAFQVKCNFVESRLGGSSMIIENISGTKSSSDDVLTFSGAAAA